MNDRDRRRYEMLVRVNQFGIDNAADFPAGSVGAVKFAVVQTQLDSAEVTAAAQSSGFAQAGQQFEIKATAREDLRDEMSDIARTARSMEYSIDGISELFRMPRNKNDQVLLAAARAFHSDSASYETEFVAYGLPADFRTTLDAAADGFENTLGTTATATDSHVAATADIAENIRLGVQAVRILDAVVRNKYATNTGKLAAWLSASHVEKDPKPKNGNGPTPPTP
jgi:hypothetical protein